MKVTPKSGLCKGREFDVVQFLRVRKNGRSGSDDTRHLCIYSEECQWLNQAKIDDFVRETEGEMRTPQGHQRTRFVDVKKPNGKWYECNPTDYIIMYGPFLYGILTAEQFHKNYVKVNSDTQLLNIKTKVGI